MNTHTTSSGANGRLASIDVLRGFDMFFITGGSALIAGLCAALGHADCWLAAQMKHVEWVGLAHHDTIFPLFLFLAGVSWPFSLAAQERRGRAKWRIQLRILARAATLALVGLCFGGILKFKPNFRLMSVLGYIGLSWGVAATAHLHLRDARRVFAAAALLLVGYWALLRFFPVPGAPVGAWPYSPEWNLPFYLDRTIWPTHTYSGGPDPESFFAFPSGAALAMIGTLAGSLLRSGDGAAAARKSLLLVAWALAAAAASAVFVYLLGDPIVKKLWTSSFVLAASSYSLAMLALLYWIVDVKGWRRWGVAFAPVGRNSILAYVLMMTGVSYTLREFLFRGVCEHSGAWRPAVAGLASYLVVWAILRFLDKKGAYVKL